MAMEISGPVPLLVVFDMPASLRFYRDVLGFELIQTSGEPGDDVFWCLLGLRGMELMLNAAHEPGARPPHPDPARVASHADTALYFACRDLDALHAHLRAHGVDARPPEMTGYGFRALTVKDPDGYQATFHWPASQEQYDAWVERYGMPPGPVPA
ncbi:MAG TPA: VOC family protein [Longimicrobium sp.]|nr:VOC family protein [Longimicrobium sp.]